MDGFETGLALGTGFGAFFCGNVLDGGGVGRFGGTAFFEVGTGGFWDEGVFVELEGVFFLASRKAFFLAESESAALTEGRERTTPTSAQRGRMDAKNRGSTRESPAGRVPPDELGFRRS